MFVIDLDDTSPYLALVHLSSDWNVDYEFSDPANHTSIRMVGTQYPNSITQPEFSYLYNMVAKNNLQNGYEVATGFGISALAAGLGFKDTGGWLVTIDGYEEEKKQDPLGGYFEAKHTDSKGYKSMTQLMDKFGLEETVFPVIGWSPIDTAVCLDAVFYQDDLLDDVFIDGYHTDEAAIADFDAIKDRLNKDKFLLAFHDSDGIPGAIWHAEDYLGIEGKLESHRPSGFCLYVIQNGLEQ